MLPHVMHTVEELSVVSDLSNWGNCNVQFIGKLGESADIDGIYTCEGIETNKKNSSVGSSSNSGIRVDFSLVAQIPPRSALVRIWGELELKNINGLTVPLVRAKIARVIGSIDLPLYRKALDVRLEYTPHFAVSKEGCKKRSDL